MGAGAKIVWRQSSRCCALYATERSAMSSSSLGKRPKAAHMSEICCGLMPELPFCCRSGISICSLLPVKANPNDLPRPSYVHAVNGPARILELPRMAIAITSRARSRLVLCALVLGLASLPLSACGAGSTSGAASSAAQEASTAISGAAAQVKSATAPAKSDSGTETATRTESGSAPPTTATKTETASAPAKTQTVTKTATRPAASVSVTNSTAVKVRAPRRRLCRRRPAVEGSHGGAGS